MSDQKPSDALNGNREESLSEAGTQPIDLQNKLDHWLDLSRQLQDAVERLQKEQQETYYDEYIDILVKRDLPLYQLLVETEKLKAPLQDQADYADAQRLCQKFAQASSPELHKSIFITALYKFWQMQPHFQDAVNATFTAEQAHNFHNIMMGKPQISNMPQTQQLNMLFQLRGIQTFIAQEPGTIQFEPTNP